MFRGTPFHPYFQIPTKSKSEKGHLKHYRSVKTEFPNLQITKMVAVGKIHKIFEEIMVKHPEIKIDDKSLAILYSLLSDKFISDPALGQFVFEFDGETMVKEVSEMIAKMLKVWKIHLKNN